MVGRDDGFPADLGADCPSQRTPNLFGNRSSRRTGKTPGPGSVVKIFSTRIGICVEDAEPVVYGLRTRQVVVADRLAEGPRPAVNHKPKSVLLVCLDFDEVVPAAECCELDRAFVPADGLKARITERSEEHTSELQSRGHLVCRL